MAAVSTQQCEESLEALTAMVNQTLIETGRFFRSYGSSQARSQLKRNFPAAHDQYHSALDNLSDQIFIAKAFLEKDYEGIVTRRIAAQQASKPPIPPPENKTRDVQMKDVGDQPQKADTKESPTKATTVPSVPAPSIPISGNALPGPPTGQPPSSAAPPVDIVTNTAVSAPLSLPAEQSDPQTGPAGDNPGTTNTVPIDIVEIDTSPDIPVQEGQPPPAEGELDLGGAFASLLPGLESYANAGTDEGVIELSGPGNSAVGGGGGGVPQVPFHQPPPTQMMQEASRIDIPMEDVGPAESNFDDLFVSSADFEGEDNLLLHGAEIGDLDDSWFAQA